MKRFLKNLIVGVTMLSAVTAVGISIASVNASKEVEVEAATNMRIYIDSENLLAGFNNLKFWYDGAGSDQLKSGSIQGSSIITADRATLDRPIHYLERASSYTNLWIKNGSGGDQWHPSDSDISAGKVFQLTSWGNTGNFNQYHMYKVHITDGSSTSDEYFVTEWNAYAAPAPKGKDGYAFTGWYKDSSYTQAFNGVAQGAGTGDINIYAKYEATSTANVYLNPFDWSNLYVYTFENVGGYKQEFNGAFPGKKISFSDPDLHFNGNSMLQKVAVPYKVLTNAKFIYSDGTSSHQSGDLSLTANAYYWHNGSDWTCETGSLATAAAYVYDFNEARMAVPASGSTKQYSICGLNAKTWVDRYDAISDATAKGYIDAASINTYKDKESSGADHRYTYAEIMVTLRSRYATASGSNVITGTEDSTSMVTIVAIFVLSAFGITSFFIFQKKKKLNIK